jgi:hypothetical protein
MTILDLRPLRCISLHDPSYEPLHDPIYAAEEIVFLSSRTTFPSFSVMSPAGASAAPGTQLATGFIAGKSWMYSSQLRAIEKIKQKELGTHQDLLDVGRVSQEHDQSIETHTPTTSGRKTILETARSPKSSVTNMSEMHNIPH